LTRRGGGRRGEIHGRRQRRNKKRNRSKVELRRDTAGGVKTSDERDYPRSQTNVEKRWEWETVGGGTTKNADSKQPADNWRAGSESLIDGREKNRWIKSLQDCRREYPEITWRVRKVTEKKNH